MKAMKLVYGQGSPESGACWMSALRMYEGGTWSDQPDCVCPVIRQLCIKLNDSFGQGAEADRQRGEFIGPHLFEPVGTRGTVETMLKRSFLCADRAVRLFAPMALRARGFEAEAAKLEALPETKDRESAYAAYAAARATASYAAAYAADAASYAADAYAAYAASYAAAYAADAASYAASYAADAYAAYAADYRNHLLKLILDCCAIDSKVPIEPACNVHKVREFCEV